MPQLPTVMMIGGEFNTPADWLRAGNAVKTIDDLAATHGGNAPVFVFVDSGGAFNNDTECVNGSRGNAADHLTKDVVPYMVSKFGVSPDAANWGIVGWSMGGTCALDLTVMHPELFSSFVDISGNMGPETGTKAQTIARLFGGNADAWAAFDPATVIAKHGRYNGVSGWFDVSSSNPPKHHRSLTVTGRRRSRTERPGRHPPASTTRPSPAESLCELGRANGINCAIVAQPGKHDWPFAEQCLSPRRCPGWPADWTHPGCRGPRCRPPGRLSRRRRGTPSRSAGDRYVACARRAGRSRPRCRHVPALGCRRSTRSARRSRVATRHQSGQPNWMPRAPEGRERRRTVRSPAARSRRTAGPDPRVDARRQPLSPRRARFSDAERRKRLVSRQFVSLPDSVGGATAGLVGLHATDPATPFLSLAARCPGFDAADLEYELYQNRSVVRHLAMRRTLWVVSADDLSVIQSAASDRVAANEHRRLVADVRKAGVATDGERWLGNARSAVLRRLGSAGTAQQY